MIAVTVVLIAFGLKLWNDRDESQISKALSQSSDLVRGTAKYRLEGVEDWLQTLVIYGRSYEALDAARKIEDAISRSGAMVSIVEATTRPAKRTRRSMRHARLRMRKIALGRWSTWLKL